MSNLLWHFYKWSDSYECKNKIRRAGNIASRWKSIDEIDSIARNFRVQDTDLMRAHEGVTRARKRKGNYV